LTADTTQPSTTINSPSASTYTSNFVINATATDGVELSTVQYRWESLTQNGSWVNLTNSASNFWTGTFSVSTLSNGDYTFRINATDASGNSNTGSSVSTVTISVSSGSSGGSGGGGSSTSSDSGTVQTTISPAQTPVNATIPPITLSEEILAVKMLEGDSSTKTVNIKNTADRDIDVQLKVKGIENIISLKEDSFRLVKGASKDIIFLVVASESIEPGVYAGTIEIVDAINGQLLQSIKLSVEVASRKALFDAKLDLPVDQRSIYSGRYINPEITLLNLGTLNKVDVFVKYALKDFENNVVLESSETLAVKDQLSYTKDIFIPDHISGGDYILFMEVRYQDSVALASQLIRVDERKGIGLIGTEPIIILLTVIGLGSALYSYRRLGGIGKAKRRR